MGHVKAGITTPGLGLCSAMYTAEGLSVGRALPQGRIFEGLVGYSGLNL